MSVLIVLTGCTSTQQTLPNETNTAKEIILGMVPELPNPPSFPQLKWEATSEGLYGINEEDADKLLNFAEYQLPLFYWELEQYEKQIQTIMDGLSTF